MWVIPVMIILFLLLALFTIARKERISAKKARESMSEALEEDLKKAREKEQEKKDLFKVLVKIGSFEHIPPPEEKQK